MSGFPTPPSKLFPQEQARGQPICVYSVKGSTPTHTEHMPKGHRDYTEWDARNGWYVGPRRDRSRRTVSGRGKPFFARAPHPQQGFRALFGADAPRPRNTAPERLEAACTRALATKDRQLQEHRVHPQAQARPEALAEKTARETARGTRQHPRPPNTTAKRWRGMSHAE